MMRSRWVVAALLSTVLPARADITNFTKSATGYVSLIGWSNYPYGQPSRTSALGGISASHPSTYVSTGDLAYASGSASADFTSTPQSVGIDYMANISAYNPSTFYDTGGQYDVEVTQGFTLPFDSDVSITGFGGASFAQESITGGPVNHPFSMSVFGYPTPTIAHLYAGTYSMFGQVEGEVYAHTGGGSGAVTLTIVKEFSSVPEPTACVLLGLPMLMMCRRKR